MITEKDILNSEIKELRAELKQTPQDTARYFEILRNIDARKNRLSAISKEQRQQTIKAGRDNLSSFLRDTTRTVKKTDLSFAKQTSRPRTSISRARLAFGLRTNGIKANPNDLFAKNTSNFRL